MKKILLIALVLGSIIAPAQESDIYTKKKYAIKGYDVVAYFSNKAVQGDSEKYFYKYDGVFFAFSSLEHLNKFKENPNKYIPQYGGHCSYAMATLGKKVSPNPTVFEIRDGKLYLFHRAKGLENWLAGDTKNLKNQADINWKKLTSN